MGGFIFAISATLIINIGWIIGILITAKNARKK